MLLSCATASAQRPANNLDRLLERSTGARQATWSIEIVNLATGRTVYAKNATKLLVPASNTKLFTTALALTRLGPEHRYRTTVHSDSAPDAAGVIHGDLVIKGGGDPNLSNRILPYRVEDGFGSDELAAVKTLAEQLRAKGVQRVTGNVVGDDTAYPWEPFPDGWAEGDAVWEYGAAVSALTLNDGAFRLRVTPGRPGAPPAVELKPAVEGMVVHNRALTAVSGPTKLNYDRRPLGRELVITGRIATDAKPDDTLMAADDPALYAAAALREALLECGVRIDGAAVARHRMPGDDEPAVARTELAALESRALAESLTVVNKVSQNLHAEMTLRNVARARRGTGSLEDGLAELRAFLAEVGIKEDEYVLRDGSGLSRLNLISADVAVRLLRYMYRSPYRDAWIATLPVGGVDGTLKTRFTKDSRGALVHAKTGTMSHVTALSGYLLPGTGPRYVFSMLANGYGGNSGEIRAIMEEILLSISKRGSKR